MDKRVYKKNFKQKCLLNNWKQPKQANCFVICGMIASGKTTLVNYLSKNLKCKAVFETNNKKNDLMNILLQKMYKREETAAAVCQLYFLLSRFDRYKKEGSKKQLVIFDRSIFEDRLFAFHNMLDQPTVFESYEKLWLNKINELAYNVGLPKVYIILKIDWKLFIKQLFKRNRKIEIENFKKNLTYFKLLNDSYLKYLTNICESYFIPYIIVDATLSLKNKIKIIIDNLKKNTIL